MDKIWDRKSVEVGDHLAVVAGMKKTNAKKHNNRTKTNSKHKYSNSQIDTLS